jgi:hypothetical protein
MCSETFLIRRVDSFATFCGECIIIDMIEPSWYVLAVATSPWSRFAFLVADLAFPSAGKCTRASSLSTSPKRSASMPSDRLTRSRCLALPRLSSPVSSILSLTVRTRAPTSSLPSLMRPGDDCSQGRKCFEDVVQLHRTGDVPARSVRPFSTLATPHSRRRRRSIYLKAHLYGSARTVDLWAGISKASGSDVSEFMHNWVTKVGFPLITVEETAEGIKVTQNRFLSTADATVRPTSTLPSLRMSLIL